MSNTISLEKTNKVQADLGGFGSKYVFYPCMDQLTGKEMPAFKVIDDNESENSFSKPICQCVTWIAPDGNEKIGFAVRTEKWRYIQWHDISSNALETKELNYIRHRGLERVNLAGRPDFSQTEKELLEKLSASFDLNDFSLQFREN